MKGLQGHSDVDLQQKVKNVKTPYTFQDCCKLVLDCSPLLHVLLVVPAKYYNYFFDITNYTSRKTTENRLK